MKMLALAILLISFPWIGHAKGWDHFNQDRHYHNGHDSSSFWQSIEQRRYRQHKRIDRGIEKGQLTRREIRELARERKHVSKQIKHFKRHRHMSYANKQSIMRHLGQYSDQIARLKHNDRYARRDRHIHWAYRQHINNDYRDGRRLSLAGSRYDLRF